MLATRQARSATSYPVFTRLKLPHCQRTTTMQGQLFSQDFLHHGIRQTPPYQALDEPTLLAFQARLQAIFAGLSAASTLNEAQTEQLVIERVLAALDRKSVV